uniref:Fukutin n=1 Tax=Neogobius melanostomus TaxID=47308 RepID=A0A8C6SKZ4_9GOBI
FIVILICGGFLWHGALRLRPDQDRSFPFTLMDYGHHQGAYDRSQLVLSVIDGLDVRVPHAHFLECGYPDARRFLLSRRTLARGARLQEESADSAPDLGPDSGSDPRPFWISSGTCLGWLRQCGVISYSRDVDIGIFIRDFRPDLVQALTRAGLRLKHRFGKVGDSLELSFVLDDVKLDIFFFYEDGDVTWNGGTQARTGRKFKYVFPCFSLCWTEFLELKVRVPCQTLDYVRANYGDGWSVPTATWDWKTSPSNVMDNGVWPADQWDELIQVF